MCTGLLSTDIDTLLYGNFLQSVVSVVLGTSLLQGVLRCFLKIIRFCSIFFLWRTLQEARAYAEENGLFFMETSAKTAANVNDIFYEIGMYVVPLLLIPVHLLCGPYIFGIFY